MKKIKTGLFFSTVSYIFFYVITKIFFKKLRQKNIWLIWERNDEARDNSYHLFKYIRENHKEINIYYVINKKCADREKIEKYSNIINFASIKHYIYYMCATLLISTHYYVYEINPRVFKKLNNIFKIQAKKVFLQHGIIMNMLTHVIYPKLRVGLFICGAKPEYEYIRNVFGYPAEIAVYTGLARYDNLLDFEVKNEILIMPTWRSWLYQLSDSEFVNSEYYYSFNNLLKNTELNMLLEKYNFQLIFYPHYEMHKFLHLFSADSKNIIFAKKENYDVQQLLKESALLITDYSSIHFDFAYMKKPILYYQFDEKSFYGKHYIKGYFDFTNNGFGEVVFNIDDLLKELKVYFENNFHMKEKYLKRVQEFFPIYDMNNCKRNFEAILNI